MAVNECVRRLVKHIQLLLNMIVVTHFPSHKLQNTFTGQGEILVGPQRGFSHYQQNITGNKIMTYN